MLHWIHGPLLTPSSDWLVLQVTASCCICISGAVSCIRCEKHHCIIKRPYRPALEPHQIMMHVFLFALCCQMLRTCSLPDLSRLFSAQQDSAVANANVAPENNLEIEDLDEAAKDDDQSETEE